MAKETKCKLAASRQHWMGAIGKTIELAELPNPLYQARTINYHASIALQMETYKQDDPTTKQQVVVPVTIPNYIYWNT